MNLLYFIQIFYPFLFGGGEYIFFLITRELAKRGHSIYIITQRFKDTEPFEVIEGIKIHRVGPEIIYSGSFPPTIKHHLDYFICACKKGREIILESRKKAQNIDIIHSNTYVPALSGQICSSLYNIPHIVSFHDVYQASSNKFWRDWMSKQNANLPFYTPIVGKLIEKIIMKLPVYSFHTVSEASREDLLAFGVSDKKIKVIPNGLDLSQYQYGRDPNSCNDMTTEPTVVFVGRLVFYKNIGTIIRAFKKVLEIIPNVRLIIVGDGPYKENLVKEAEPIKNNVVFTGRISSSEKIKIINAASFVVFPSFIEGFGILIIEGFACNKPVLVSDVRPLSDIVEDSCTGYVIPSLNADAWADKMIDLLNNTSKQKEMGDHAYKEFISKYEIKGVVSKMEVVYKTACNHREQRTIP